MRLKQSYMKQTQLRDWPGLKTSRLPQVNNVGITHLCSLRFSVFYFVFIRIRPEQAAGEAARCLTCYTTTLWFTGGSVCFHTASEQRSGFQVDQRLLLWSTPECE